MTIISPSLLSADFLKLHDDIERLNQAENIWLHLDIMDGHFVPNLTFGPTVIKNLAGISKHKLDAHLMVTNPELFIDPLRSAGVYNFTFHWEAVIHHDRLIAELKKNFPSVGVSLNPSTSISVIPQYLLKELDLILIMSVNPGFGGQSFIEGTLDKVKKLSELKTQNNYSYQIQIDGGVKESNAKQIVQAGADNLVAGSFVFGVEDKDYKSQIEKLR